MDTDNKQAGAAAQWAKGALRSLAQSRLEPTPANFAKAYAEESGGHAESDDAMPARARPVFERLAMRALEDATQRGELVAGLMGGRWDDAQRSLERNASASAQQAQAWVGTLERLVRGLDRGGKQWTLARKKDSLQRLLDTGRGDAARLQQRLQQLVTTWDADQPGSLVEPAMASSAPASPDDAFAPQADAAQIEARAAVDGAGPAALADASARAQALHTRMLAALQTTVRAGLPTDEPRAGHLADELSTLADRIAAEGATPELTDAVAEVCQQVQRLFGLRHELVAELLTLTRSLTEGVTELAEDGSWAKGQGDSLRERLSGGANARTVRAARELLDHARLQQRSLHSERQTARDALKQMVQKMLSVLGTLDHATGSFSDKAQGFAAAIEAADSLDSLGHVVREMVGDSQAVHQAVSGARARLSADHARATALENKVRGLEAELRRLSDEVSTDALTQVANRRGLQLAYDRECARIDSNTAAASTLAVGLIDIDNFKKLNDSLGHAAGDVALKSLAARVRDCLRPVDHLARFGGEEFVVLLPDMPVDQALQALTRLQRKLTASLFMHDGKEVFVTFSAGVTMYRTNEALELAIERADEALYEAKRTGKNRSCVA